MYHRISPSNPTLSLLFSSLPIPLSSRFSRTKVQHPFLTYNPRLKCRSSMPIPCIPQIFEINEKKEKKPIKNEKYSCTTPLSPTRIKMMRKRREEKNKCKEVIAEQTETMKRNGKRFWLLGTAQGQGARGKATRVFMSRQRVPYVELSSTWLE